MLTYMKCQNLFLEIIWKKVSKKGIIWFDDYEGFPGAKMQ